MKSTIVVNVQTDEFDVYIGRRSTRARDVRCHTASEFANPFKVGPWLGDAQTPADAIAMFEQDLRLRLALDPALKARLLALEGKRLGCWCKPKACHGDVLVKLIHEFKGTPA